MTKAEKTRQFIVEKTAALFNMKGYAGTSMSDMTEATGLTKGSIYGNFDNKDDVALAVFDFNLARLLAGITSATNKASISTDKLLQMANFYRTDFKRTLVAGGCPILNTATEADDTIPHLKERVAKGLRKWKSVIEQIVKQGVLQKQIKPSADATKFATEFIALIEGGILLSQTTGNQSMLLTCIYRIERIIEDELKL